MSTSREIPPGRTEDPLHRMVDLKTLIPDESSPADFISFPFEPRGSCFHEGTQRRYPLGSYRLRNMILVGAHALLSTIDHYLLREQNAETRVSESYWKVSPHARRDAAPVLDSVVSLVSAPSYNFYHWTIDSLPKVIVAEACGFQGAYVVPPSHMNPRVEESLDLLGISSDRIVPMDFGFIVATELWFPTHFHGHRMADTPILHRKFRDQVLQAAAEIAVPENERVYIRRSPNSQARTIVNGAEVEELLGTFGFKTFAMEHLTLREQVAICAKAKAMLGPHGAGMLQSLWMNPGSTVIELLPENYQNDCMQVHSRLLGHNYTPFVVEQSDKELRMTVDCDRLQSELRRIFN